ncbi:myb-related transcription factor, partner of profilin-like [Mya arenaria]|uniref:myb-related transcription factor, partner of profilin-like n=1 Tax=Mya arenaria TaxID=6604 RepID=UPI0022E78056|nr:myb-related transcription factor, partner of profilin-like [Mya arenaria]
MTERKQNWTLRELEELAAGYKKHCTFLTSKHGPSSSEAEKKRVLNEILLSVNSVGGNGRTIDEMSKKWKDLKSRTKKKEQGRLKALRSSGLGTIPQTLILTELEERVLSCIPAVSVTGIQTGVDTNRSFSKFLGVANEDEVEDCQCSDELISLQRELLAESRTRNELLREISGSLKSLVSQRDQKTLSDLLGFQ